MRAAVIKQWNEPWSIESVADPRPSSGQVLIRVKACGMCGTDVHVHHGMMAGMMKLPAVAGHEPVGEVVELGPGVTSLRKGDRVGVKWVQRGCGRCRACQIGRELYCRQQTSWMSNGGGYGELMVADEGGCALLPDGLAYPLAKANEVRERLIAGKVRYRAVLQHG